MRATHPKAPKKKMVWNYQLRQSSAKIQICIRANNLLPRSSEQDRTNSGLGQRMLRCPRYSPGRVPCRVTTMQPKPRGPVDILDRPNGLAINLANKVARKLHDLAFRASAGLGTPISVDAWNCQYASGHWDYLANISELGRYAVVASYVGRLRPRGTVLDVGWGLVSYALVSMLLNLRRTRASTSHAKRSDRRPRKASRVRGSSSEISMRPFPTHNSVSLFLTS